MLQINRMHLHDVMDRNVFSVALPCHVGDMIKNLQHNNVSHVVVTDDNKAVGIFTERDLVRVLNDKSNRESDISELMSTQIVILSDQLQFRNAYIQLCLNRLRHLVVINEQQQIIGVATEQDFLGHMGLELFRNVHDVLNLVDGKIPQLPPATTVEAGVQTMLESKRGCIIVAEDGKYLGLFTEYQAPRVMAHHHDDSAVKLHEVMLQSEPVSQSTAVSEVVSQLVSDRTGHVVVIDDDGSILGTIAQSRLLENVRTAVYGEIASRQLVEDQLLRMETQLEATLEHTPNVAVQWYDQQGNIQYWNHASELLYGWTADEISTHSAKRLFRTEQEYLSFKGVLDKVACEDCASGPLELKKISRNGQLKWLESTLFSIPGEQQDELFFVCMDVDISRHKEDEETLRHSEEKYRFLAESLPDMVYQMSLPDGRYEFVSTACEKIFGVAQQQWYDKPGLIKDLLTPAWIPYFETEWEKLITEGNQASYEYQINHPHKGIRWLQQHNQILKNSDGTPIRITGVVRDITDQKNLENDLRASEKRFRDISHIANDWFWEVDASGVYTYVSDTVENFLGYQQHEVIGRSPFELMPPEEAENITRVFTHYVSQKKPFKNLQNKNLHKDGHLIILETSGVPILSDDGELLGYRGTDTDITERFQFTENLEQLVEKRTRELHIAKELSEQANIEKSRFLANMSHELRTPMHAILSFSKLAQKRDMDDKARHFLENIEVSTIRLTELLNGLLDLSKLEAGKMQLSLANYNIADLVKEALTSLSSLIDTNQLKINLSGLEPINGDMDKNLIIQVIINLLSNAIKFSPANAEISIQTGIKQEKDIQCIHLAVSDQGIGIPENELGTVFDAFVQSSKTVTGSGGTGLGLPISKEIILMHHGKIWAESIAGQGATFHVLIPSNRNSNPNVDINSLIQSHNEWKLMIEALIKGRGSPSHVSPEMVGNPYLCELGKWLESDETNDLLSAENYQLLKKDHDAFHSIAQQILSEHSAGQYEQLQQLLQKFEYLSLNIRKHLKAVHL